MKTTLGWVEQNIYSVKICKECNSINHNDNEECHACQSEENRFNHNQEDIQKVIDEEIAFYTDYECDEDGVDYDDLSKEEQDDLDTYVYNYMEYYI